MKHPATRRIEVIEGRYQVMRHNDGGREPGIPVGPPWESNRDAQAYLRALEHKGPVSPLRDEDE